VCELTHFKLFHLPFIHLPFTSLQGTIIRIVKAISVENGIGKHGNGTDYDNFVQPKEDEYNLSVVALIADSKDIATVALHVMRCVESTLGEVDYFQSRVAATMTGKKLRVAQDFIALRLHSVCNVLHNLLMACMAIDAVGGANCSLVVLKAVKRVFTNTTKLLVSLLKGELGNPSLPVQAYLSFTSDKIVRVVVEVLAYCSEENKTGGYNSVEINESQIAAQGRLASSLVFEREKMDMTLLKIAKKYYSAKITVVGDFYSRRVTTKERNRDFRIKKNEIDVARRKAEEKEKRAGARPGAIKKEKREKPKKEGRGKKRKKQEDVEVVDLEIDDDGDHDGDHDDIGGNVVMGAAHQESDVDPEMHDISSSDDSDDDDDDDDDDREEDEDMSSM